GTPGATGTQTISLSSDSSTIAGGHVKATLSAWLGGFGAQSDYATVTAQWLDGAGADIGSPVQIGPVTHVDRGDTTELQKRTTTVTVPSDARSVRVVIEMTRFDPSNDDGYADNVSLVLTDATPPPEPQPTPTGDPPPFTSPPVDFGPPEVQGDVRAREPVGCMNGVWLPDPDSFSYGWSFDGKPIPGADSVSYTLPANAKGHKIACIVTATSEGKSAAATSAPVAVAAKAGCPLVGGKPTCLKRGRPCKPALRDDYLRAGFVCKRKGRKRVLARASEAQLRGDSGVRLQPDGLPTFQGALQEFDKLIAPLPGVKQTPGAIGDSRDGTEALRWILRYRDRLTPAQKAVVDKVSAPPPAVSTAAVPDVANYRALVPEAINRLASHGIVLKRAVSVTGGATYLVKNSPALAYAQAAWLDGTGDHCQITITPEGAADFAAEGRETIVHELFHCAQAEAMANAQQWANAPSFAIEGGATWVEGRIGPEWTGHLAESTKGWYLNWLEHSDRDLFRRDYDAVGFYELLAHEGADVWPLLLQTAQVGGAQGPGAAMFTGLNAGNDVRGAWGPTLATTAANGPYWDLHIPNYPINTAVHGRLIRNGTDRIQTTDPRAGYAAQLPIEADVVTIAIDAGKPIGRFRPPGEDDQPLTGGTYCAKPGGCECPGGGDPGLPEMNQGDAYIGWSALGVSAVEIQGESLDKWCKRPHDQGINIHKLVEGGGAEPLAGTIKAGNCRATKTSFTAVGKSTNKVYTLKVTIGGAFQGFGHDYPLVYGGTDPTFTLEGPGGPFSNYSLPGNQNPGGGAIHLPSGGKVMGFGFVPTFNADASAGVTLAGGMTCRYPRKRG
ncbi:MAG: hypothetical protein QOD63_1150, partial [Actinomycetota bacterium]|nr:hypothetical protein [Actinomycetota bacterium]